MNSKTVVIWDTVEGEVRFFVSDDDLSRFNRKYVNSMETSDEDTDSICDLVYDKKGEEKVKMLDAFPVEEVLAGARVVVIGFLP